MAQLIVPDAERRSKDDGGLDLESQKNAMLQSDLKKESLTALLPLLHRKISIQFSSLPLTRRWNFSWEEMKQVPGIQVSGEGKVVGFTGSNRAT